MLGSGITLAGLFVLCGSHAGELSVGFAHPSAFHDHPQPRAQAGAQDEDLAKLRRELMLPGPESRQKRENAIAALLSMRSTEAHAALQEVLLAGDDPDDVGGSILLQLSRRLANDRDPVLGDPDNEAVLQLRSSYVRPLVLRLSARPTDEAARDRARDALLAIRSWERVPVFRALLQPGSIHRTAAATAAGLCQDLSLARMLGAFVEDDDATFRAAVHRSLDRLTFHPESFETVAAFEKWYDQLGAKTFVHLAEEEALNERRRGRAARRELVLELIGAYVGQAQIQWQRLQPHLLVDQSEIRGAALTRLRDLLRQIATLTGSTSDRLALFEALEQRLRQAESEGLAEHALLLETCAYLLDPGEGEREARQRMAERLGASLRDDRPAEVRRAALAGLRRYPSEFNRQQVVTAAQHALQNDAPTLLSEALATLGAKGWMAPTADAQSRASWVALLRAAVVDRELAEPLRRQALAVLGLRDGDKARVAAGFDILHEVIADQEQSPKIRDLALIEVTTFAETAEQKGRYFELLRTCLSDPAYAIRHRVATLLPQVPAPGNQDELRRSWTGRLLDAARSRLLEEPDAKVHGAIAESMRRIADQTGDYKPVIEHLCGAAEEFAKAPSEKREAFRHKNLVEALRILASSPERGPELWVRSGEVVLELGERQSVRWILARHEESKSLAKAGVPPAVVQRGHRLTLRTALRRQGDMSWKDESLAGEVQAVLAAVAALAAVDALPIEPEATEVTLLRMDILGDLGRHDEVIALSKTLRPNDALDERQRLRAALRAARSYLAEGNPATARDWLFRLTGNGGVPADVLHLLENVCSTFLASEKFADAERVGEVLVERTLESSPRYPARLLLLAKAIYRTDPDKNAARVRELLDAKSALFSAQGTPESVTHEFRALLARVRGAESG